MSSQAGRYYIPDPSHWPIFGSIALLLMAFGATTWFNGGGRPVGARRRPRCAGLHVVRLVWHGRPRKRRRPLQPAGRRLVPLGHELVHLLGSDVLRGVFRRALLHARALLSRGWDRAIRRSAVAELQGRLAGCGSGHRVQFTPMGAWGIPAINTADPACRRAQR